MPGDGKKNMLLTLCPSSASPPSTSFSPFMNIRDRLKQGGGRNKERRRGEKAWRQGGRERWLGWVWGGGSWCHQRPSSAQALLERCWLPIDWKTTGCGRTDQGGCGLTGEGRSTDPASPRRCRLSLGGVFCFSHPGMNVTAALHHRIFISSEQQLFLASEDLAHTQSQKNRRLIWLQVISVFTQLRPTTLPSVRPVLTSVCILSAVIIIL